MKDEQHAEAFWNRVSLAKKDALPLGERVTALHHNSQIRNDVKLGHGGSREISFITRSSSKYEEDEVLEIPHQKKKGIQSLGLKPDRSGFQGRGREEKDWIGNSESLFFSCSS